MVKMAQENPGASPVSVKTSAFRAREYQYEMYDRSMKRNVVVAMDTGSGKTHIALLRIMAELDRCPPKKLVWFLAPTVALCTQQQALMGSQLPAVRTRLLIGSDNIDRWSEQRIWDAALHNIQVVVSTHAVLADALTHGFVKMANLALLIFDEAHHCARGHPANRIMQNFYHPLKAERGPTSVPHILGLSASPILRSKISELGKIEANLDSICITPRIHREEMLKYVHRPTLHKLVYEPHSNIGAITSSRALRALLNIPDVVYNQHGSSNLAKQLTKFCKKATHVYEELGAWAADHFITESIAVLENRTDLVSSMFAGGKDVERRSILRVLNHDSLLRLRNDRSLRENFVLSLKVEQLLAFLCGQDHSRCTGLLFVRERATVSVLCTLLSNHPKTKDLFRCATFVGLSNNASRKCTMAELLDLKAQRETLTEFRAQRKNLIIATDVLEEGIDVSACNLVVCFDPPPNLKSFIQRRGRARQEQSSFAIMLPEDDVKSKLDTWRGLEEALIRAYQDELRQIQDLAAIEDDVEVVPGKLEVKSTGACLTPDSAIGHVHHFCARLPHEPYVDLRPAFTFSDDPITRLITATVTLPNCLNSSLRSTGGSRAWRTERAAAQDAAFQAYVALYKAGLLNDNLLPLSKVWELEDTKLGEFPATVEVSRQLSPWAELAESWSSPDLHQTRVSVRDPNAGDLSMVLTTPSLIPAISSFPLYWDEITTFTIEFDNPRKVSLIKPDSLQLLQKITHVLNRSTHSDNNNDSRIDFIALFGPNLEEEQLAAWYIANCGRLPALKQFNAGVIPRSFIRKPLLHGIPHIFRRWQVLDAEHGDTAQVECEQIPRRRNFLVHNTLSKRRKLSEDQIASPTVQTFQSNDCTIDRLPLEYARFNMFIPAILRHIEALMIADKLCKTILKEVPFKTTQNIVTAISAPSANWVTDYQRYEFFGDTLLKFTVSYQLFCDHGNWHEGYLSEQRNRIVSNQWLAKAALSKGLDAFVMTEAGKGKSYSPMFVSEGNSHSRGKRTISTKVVADVVEALIGAAYVDGGFHTTRACIHAFLPDIRIEPPQIEATFSNPNHAVAVTRAESVIGYKFRNKTLLLEALTHPSCERDVQTQSYQRFEFLGDAILDYLVVSFLAEHRKQLSQGRMTLIKAALVNIYLLGFLCLEFSHEQKEVISIQEQPAGRFGPKVGVEQVHLWKIMRHHNQDIAKTQSACLERYNRLKTEIRHALDHGQAYPWVQLSKLSPDKFYSDMVESLVGAIFVDSNGNFAGCQRFAIRIGLIPYLERLVTTEIDVSHPRDVLMRLAGSDSVNLVIKKERSSADSEIDHHQCKVTVDGVEIVEVKDCLSKDEAITVGAQEAAEKLKMRKRETEA